MDIPIQLLEGGYMPEKRNENDAAFDLRARTFGKVYTTCPVLVPCGFKIDLPEGYVAKVVPRSGLALKHSLTVLNSPGIIDPGYSDEVCVVLFCFRLDIEFLPVYPGDRIAQMLIERVEPVGLKQVDTVSGNRSGFGSTGIR